MIFLTEGTQSYFSQARIMMANIIAIATIYNKDLHGIAKTALFLFFCFHFH